MAIENLDRIKDEFPYMSHIAPSERSFWLFNMCSHNIESFEKFIKIDRITNHFILDEKTRAEIENNKDALI